MPSADAGRAGEARARARSGHFDLAAERHRAELEAVYDAISDGILVVDMGGSIVYANDAMIRYGGFASLEEMRAAAGSVGSERGGFELRTADGAQLPLADWPASRVLRGESVHDLDLEVRRVHGGETRWFTYNCQPVLDHDGTQLLAVIVARDITARKRAERRLRESEERARARAEELERTVEELRAVLDTVPAAVWIARDREGSRIDANRSGAELLARPRGSNVSITAPDDERPTNFTPMKDGVAVPPDELPIQAAARHGKESRDYEFDLVFDDGSVRHLLGNATPLRDERGEPRGAVGAFIDITERKRAEAAMAEERREARARAALVEAVLDCVGDGVLVYDAQARTLRSTPAADAILGVPPSERLAPVQERVARQYEVRDEEGRVVAPEEMVAVRAAVHGETIRNAIHEIRSGDRPPRWLLINATPLVVSGQHTGAVLSLTDLTERKAAEAELALVTRLYAVLSRVNEAIVRTRDEVSLYDAVCRIVAEDGAFPLVWVGLVRDRRIVPVASAGTAGALLGEIEVEVDGELGRGPTGTCVREGHAVIHPDFAASPPTCPWREASLRHGLRASAAVPLRREGAVIGAITFYADSAGAFTAKQVRLLESLCADVSFALDALRHERLRVEAEIALRDSERSLREADRRKDEFLGMLSHELRNPLAPIRNSVQVLRHAAPDGEQAARARAIIERQADHLTHLVDDLLDVTRIARGKIQLRTGRVDLRELVLRAADDFRALMDERALAFRIEVPPAHVWVDADATRLVQVVGNLLHNAAKFSRRGGTVTLSLREGEAGAEIRVRDTGVGIDGALLPQVFEAFVQGERTLARTEGGLGLGLALVKGIVELHGGSVRADSAGVGQGAELTVRLPHAPRAVTADPSRTRSGSAAGARRILVVDDNVDAAESLCDLLRLLGHEVDVAHDGASALERARAGLPEVVLCDIGLPGMSGYDVARALRGDPALRATRLVALSGYAQVEDRERAREAGFDAHVAKPPDLDELLATIARER